MKTRKLRILSALLALAMLFALMPTAAFADDSTENNIITYDCGENGNNNVVATLDTTTGTLTISGKGDMADYNVNDQPWAGQRSNIKHLVVTDGVTSIGNNAFSYCTNLIDADMSKALSLRSISTSFWGCTGLNNVVLNEGLATIGGSAFSFCEKLKSIHIPSTVTGIGGWCFQNCYGLEEVTFEDGINLTTIGGATFIYCRSLKKIMIPKSVEVIKKDVNNGAFEDCLDLESVIFEPGSKLNTVENFAFYNCNKATIYCEESKNDILGGKCGNIKSLNALNPVVTFEVDGKEFEKQNAKDNNFKAAKPENPAKKGYVFTGWYTKNANNEYKPFDFNTTVTEDITLYAQWEELPDHQLTVIGGTFAVKDETIKTETKDDAVIANIPVDAEVTVAFNKEAYADSNQTFGGWVIEGLNHAENYTNQETFTFTMPQNGVRIEAMTKVVNVDDSGWDAATVVTGAVIGTGTAILAYHIGMEVYAEQVLGKDVAVPRTRGEVALLAWQLAGSPEPNAAFELLTDEAKAQQWAVESGLLQLDAEGNFHAEKKLSKWKALRVLDKAKKQV